LMHPLQESKVFDSSLQESKVFQHVHIYHMLAILNFFLSHMVCSKFSLPFSSMWGRPKGRRTSLHLHIETLNFCKLQKVLEVFKPDCQKHI
jgi:hypothetical protein